MRPPTIDDARDPGDTCPLRSCPLRDVEFGAISGSSSSRSPRGEDPTRVPYAGGRQWPWRWIHLSCSGASEAIVSALHRHEGKLAIVPTHVSPRVAPPRMRIAAFVRRPLRPRFGGYQRWSLHHCPGARAANVLQDVVRRRRIRLRRAVCLLAAEQQEPGGQTAAGQSREQLVKVAVIPDGRRMHPAAAASRGRRGWPIARRSSRPRSGTSPRNP